jgi:hypothetical protein
VATLATARRDEQLVTLPSGQTKVHKYLGNRVARHIVGQPRSTIDFRHLVATGKIVSVNLNASARTWPRSSAARSSTWPRPPFRLRRSCLRQRASP